MEELQQKSKKVEKSRDTHKKKRVRGEGAQSAGLQV